MQKLLFTFLYLSQNITTMSSCYTYNSTTNKCYVAHNEYCYFINSNYDIEQVNSCHNYCLMHDARLDCAICEENRLYTNKRCYSSPSENKWEICFNYYNTYFQTSYEAKCNPKCWAPCRYCTYYNKYYHCRYCKNLGGQLYSNSSQQCSNATSVNNCWVIESGGDCKICNDYYIMNQDQRTCSQIDTSISNCLNYDKFQCQICKENFQFNKNYYAVLFDSVSLAYHSPDFLQDILFTPYRMHNTLVDQCEPIQQIDNCVKYLTGIKCQICSKSSGLIPAIDMLSCIDPFRFFVEFCEVYNIAQAGCKLCQQGYYLKDDLCKRVDDVNNCILYELNTCVQCSNEYKLIDGSCTQRTLIQNCQEYEISEDFCKQCVTNYQTTVDRLRCTPIISNCKQHDINEFGNSKCVQCNDNYFISFLQICQYGNVSNCKVYQTTGYNQCQQCNHNYYLQSPSSCIYDYIDNCVQHDYNLENVCTTCNIEYVLLEKYSSCQSIITISQCNEYEYSDKCKKCNDYYYLNEFKTQCNPIPSSNTNCKQFNPQDKCTLCEDNYSILNGYCILNNEYFEFCNQSQFYGQLFNNYVCDRCIENYTPVDLTDYYGCHSYDFMYQKGLTDPDQNCLKYGYDSSSQTFICELCNDGFYIRNGNCLDQCESNELIFKYTISKVQIPLTLDYNYIKYSGQNICGQLVDSEPNCTQVSPDIFFQAKDYRKVTYSCIECNSNSIKLPKVKSVVSEYTPDINTQDARYGKNPLRIFPGLMCKDKTNIRIEGILSSGLINGCEYYVELGQNSNTGDTSYGCLKCEFGKNGIIERHKSSNRGYIKECVDFELPEEQLNQLDGVCNTARFMFGFTHNSNDTNWNQVPLETYLSCHDCISPIFPFYLFLFISFEDISKFSTGTSFSYKKNNMKNHSMLLDYQMPNDPTPGRTLRCLTFDLDKMFNFEDTIPNTIKQDMFFPDYLEKCQLFIVNTLKYKYVLNTYKPNPEIINEIIYCGACKPGFKAVKFSPLDTGESEINQKEYFYPYKIFNCLKIDNCNTATGNWVNNCEFCQPTYTWYWNDQNKSIEYNRCLKNIHLNCLAVDDNGICRVCNKGFEFQDGNCIKFIGNKCQDNETLFVRDFPVNTNYIDFARNYFYIRDKTRGCNKCENNISLDTNLRYVSFINKPSTFNRLQRIHCMTNCQNQCDQNQELWERVIFIPNCKFYKYITLPEYNNYGENIIKVKCHECNVDYVLNSIEECIDATGFDNCYKVDVETNTCIECINGYYFANNACILPNVPNCLEYDNYPSSTSLICSKCVDYYFLNTSSNQCISGTIPNCKTYASQTMCEICDDNYQNYKIDNIKTECIQLKSEFNCLKLNYQKFLDNVYECEKCIDNYIQYVSTNADPQDTMCYDHPRVSYCIKYHVQEKVNDSTFRCIECSSSYFVNEVSNTCQTRTANYSYCMIRILNEDKCQQCNNGYSLTEDQRNCLPNEVQVSGCARYRRERYCEECQDRYYLENNNCIFVEAQDAIVNCIRYVKTTSIKCSKCAPLYYLDETDGQCKVGLVPDCQELINKTNCKYCSKDFQLYLKPNANPALEGTLECKLLETDTNRPLNCEISDILQPSVCQTCIDNTYAKNGVCTSVPTANRTSNCLKYQLNVNNVIVCYLCTNGYYLYWVTDKYTCVQISSQTEQPGSVHNNCRQIKKFDLAQCNSCPRNFHFDWDNNFASCVSNNISNCAILRERNPSQCNSCSNSQRHNGDSCY